MRARLKVFAIIAVSCTGCSTAAGLRAHADRGAPIVVSHAASPLQPATGLMLVNPLFCFAGGGGGGGGGGYAALAYAAIVVGCTAVLGVVDLVALPVQAVRRNREESGIARIGSICPLVDPAAQVADRLGTEMVRDFHFSAVGPDAPVAKPADAVTLHVSTTTFTWSSRIHWEGSVVFRAPDGDALWTDSCIADAPPRGADTFEDECDAARAEIAAGADVCVRRITNRLREAWRADSVSAPAGTGEDSDEATAPRLNDGDAG